MSVDKGKRVIVCGGRDYSNEDSIWHFLTYLHRKAPIALLIHGGATGADAIASQWAIQHRVRQLPFPADWKKHGKSAGPIRNQAMIDEGKPDMVIAFPGGKGTADMKRRAQAAGIELHDYHGPIGPRDTVQ